MKPFAVPVTFLPVIVLFLASGLHAQTPPSSPPVAAARPVTDTYFGTPVTDPYRWMENLGDPEVKSWFRDQADYARASLDAIPGRDQLLAQIKSLDNAGTYVNDVQLAGNRLFCTKWLPGFNTAKLYVRDGLHGTDRLLFDPEKLTQGSTHFSIDYYAPSLNGTRVAYGLSSGGSEESVIHILEVSTGKESPETIDRARFGGVSWRLDGHSFFYDRQLPKGPGFKPQEDEQKVKTFLHIVGTDPVKDSPILGYGISPRIPMTVDDTAYVGVNPDSPFAVAVIRHGVLNEQTVYLASLASVTDPHAPWRKIVDTPDEITGFTSHGDLVYLLSHKGASRYKLLRIHYSHPELSRAEVVLPPSHSVLTELGAAQDALYVVARDGGITRLLRVPYSGGPAMQVTLPYDGFLHSLVTDYRHPGALFLEGGWTHSALWYAYDPKSRTVSDTKLKPLNPVSMAAYEAVEVNATGKDGTLIPLSIITRKGLTLDGSHPALLDGYGAYAITTDPGFDPARLPWLERGGVLAFAHVRGGGEFGDDWHRAGMKLTKHNTWEDFVACGQYLVDHGYTSPAHLAGEGTSAGGITIGRSITERPDLFGAALIRVGSSNPLRAEQSPNGPANIPEFGSVTTPNGFQGLYAMDAYQHVQDGVKYPAVMVETGINDPRVSSWEPAKMAARLQAASSSGKPVLLRVDYEAGHGFGSTRAQDDILLADEYAFLLWQLGDPAFQPKPADAVSVVSPVTVTGE